MATKKDLVEAYAFSRRRLVTAFVSGAPGGREVEPTRPGRAVIGGIALAVLLVAAAAITGVFKGRQDVDWEQAGLVVDDDSGALYVNLGDDIPGFDDDEPRLRPVVNVTSARLILGPEVMAEEASPEDIAAEGTGPPIGIADAPATVPPVGNLVNTGWTACTSSGHGVRTTVAEEQTVPAMPEAGLVVRNGRTTYLIATGVASGDSPARAYRYAFPKGPDNIFNALGVAIPADAVEVPDEWLALFPEGGDVGADGLGITGAGSPPPPEVQSMLSADAKIGDYFVQGDYTLVITQDGVSRFDDFAAAVLANSRLGRYEPKELTDAMDPDVDLAPSPYGDSHWPAALPGASNGSTDALCAVLLTGEGEQPAVTIGIDPTGDAVPDDIDPEEREVSVDSGHGSVVRVGDWVSSEAASAYLIDDRGLSHKLRNRESVTNLGYADVDEVVVPDSWLELFVRGVELSKDAALCPPESENAPSCS